MRTRFYQSILLVLSIALVQTCFAIQEKPIKDNGTAKAYVSIHGLTRIAVDNDRVQDVRGPEDAYQIKTDANQGAVFIQPTPVFQKRPFTIFLATEQGHDYMLRLMPRNQPANTILLKPQGVLNPAAVHWETTSPYTEAITELMKDMVNQTLPEGYAVDAIGKAKNQRVGDVNIKPIQIYQVTNCTAQTIILNEREFYQSGVRAIALTQQDIAPHGQIFLYRVSSDHE